MTLGFNLQLVLQTEWFEVRVTLKCARSRAVHRGMQLVKNYRSVYCEGTDIEWLILGGRYYCIFQ
jgi:hypothetical protein